MPMTDSTCAGASRQPWAATWPEQQFADTGFEQMLALRPGILQTRAERRVSVDQSMQVGCEPLGMTDAAVVGEKHVLRRVAHEPVDGGVGRIGIELGRRRGGKMHSSPSMSSSR